jgi:cell division protease FtsH
MIEKLEFLNKVKNELKEEFFGIDDVIDSVFDKIEGWYVYPEYLSRPIIINLWGLTGVGKTDLVRKIVNKLTLKDRFLDIQMTSKGIVNKDWNDNTKSFADIFYYNYRTFHEQQSVILLDEFQTFRTKDESGVEKDTDAFNDVWQLLSDGNFSVNVGLLNAINKAIAYRQFIINESKSKNEKKSKTKKTSLDSFAGSDNKIDYYCDDHITDFLNLEKPIWEYTQEEYLQILISEFNRIKSSPVDINLSKLLIFVSGNLNDLYLRSDFDNDTSADVFYDYSKLINIYEVKTELGRFFKPEQIARFGNNHIIYPSISEESYRKIIYKTLAKTVDKIKDFAIIINESVYDFIYKNGVFPTQGARPVFSSIASYIDANIPKIAIYKNTHNHKDIILKVIDNHLVINDDYKIKLHILEENTEDWSDDVRRLITVHECGHALINILEKGYVPKVINVRKKHFDSYCQTIQFETYTKKCLEIQIKVLLAGYCAEKYFFGESYSEGSSSDFMSITGLVKRLYDENGFNDEFLVYSQENGTVGEEKHIIKLDSVMYNNRYSTIKGQIDGYAKELVAIFDSNKELLIKLIEIVYEKRKVYDTDIIDMIRGYVPTVKMYETFDVINPHNYNDLYEQVVKRI